MKLSVMKLAGNAAFTELILFKFFAPISPWIELINSFQILENNNSIDLPAVANCLLPQLSLSSKFLTPIKYSAILAIIIDNM